MTTLEELVLEEAKNLKKHATKQEISNLDFDGLDSQDANRCIYGQMTGSCFSERAIQLIQICAEKVYNEGPLGGERVHDGVELNGSPLSKNRFSYFSPIEVFISKHPSIKKAGKLISFLKGETKKLF